MGDRARPTLALVDGHSLLHRAYFALPVLTNAEGQPTHAVFGFLNMLFRLVEDAAPTHLVVALDRPGPTFRDRLYEAYKAHRPPMAPDLKSQEPLLEEALRVLAIPVVGASGYEADDVIGTLAARAVQDGFHVVVVTGDRDAFQLVGPEVEVLVTRTGIRELERVDEEAIRARYGLEPRQLVDVKALMGDPSDNIPGVPGVGEKTALDLVRRFGSLEAAIAEAEQGGAGRASQALVRHAELARLSRRLAEIDREAPVALDWEDCRLSLPPEEAVREFFQRMDFRNLLRRYPAVRRRAAGTEEARDGASAAGGSPAPAPLPVASDWRRVEGGDGWREALSAIAGEGAVGVAFLADRDAVSPGRPRMLAVAPASPAEPFCGPAPDWSAMAALGRLPKVGHGLKPLAAAAAYAGQAWSGWSFDTELAAYLLDPGRGAYPLESLARRYLGLDVDPPAAAASQAEVEAWLVRAAAIARDLVGPLRAELEAMGLWELYQGLELPLLPVLARMEAHGVLVDRGELERLRGEFEARLRELEAEIYRLAGEPFNIQSTPKLREVLFERLKLTPQRRTKTGFSTDAETLEALAAEHPLPAKILEYRGLAKLLSTYVEGLAQRIDPRTGRIHTTFAQTVAATGRLSSVDPNLQNIPVREEPGRRLRRAFVAAPGHLLVSADYSQIEMRLLAHFAGDEGLIRIFRSGGDVHRQTAAEVMGVAPEDVTPAMRDAAKAVNFGIIYGISDFGLARNLGIPQEEAHAFIERYFERYPAVRRYLQGAVAAARETGYVRTLFGRIRHLPEIGSRNFARRQYAERTAMNTPLQGTAADLIKRAMLRVDEALAAEGLGARLVLQVHDELIFEAPESEVAAVANLAREAMEGAAELAVPLVAETKAGPDWYAMTALA